MITLDQGIPYQQNRAQRNISILVIRSRTSQLEDLLPSVNAILDALKAIKPGQIAIV